eukprot:5954763-Heterocapsa_arctica.AAC.1
MSEWTRFLGKEIQWVPTGYRVRVPPTYVDTIVELLRLERARPAPTPFLTVKDHEEAQPCDEAEHHLYRMIVGRCPWMATERPDVSYAVKALARA